MGSNPAAFTPFLLDDPRSPPYRKDLHTDTKDIAQYLEYLDDKWRLVITEVRDRLIAALPPVTRKHSVGE